MSNRSLVVQFKTVPGRRREFLRIIKEHAAGTLAEEEGCLAFDVCVPEDDEHGVWLYERYRDDAALEVHKASRRLARTRERYADLIESRTIAVCEVQDLA